MTEKDVDKALKNLFAVRMRLGHFDGDQQSLITAVASAAKRPVVLLLLTGGPVDVTFAQSNPKIGAILWAGYPGQADGLAIAKVLFGDHIPSGRLPVTWYPEEFTKVPMTDMRMRADPATGYPGAAHPPRDDQDLHDLTGEQPAAAAHEQPVWPAGAVDILHVLLLREQPREDYPPRAATAVELRGLERVVELEARGSKVYLNSKPPPVNHHDVHT